MDAERAKRYFPLIGTAARVRLLLRTCWRSIPGMPVATSNLNITLGCGLVVFILFNAYGLMTNGWAYVEAPGRPAWWLAPLVLPDRAHLALRAAGHARRAPHDQHGGRPPDPRAFSRRSSRSLVPIPLMLLGCLVVVVQTLVFTLLTCVYIGLATEHEAAEAH